MKVIGENIKKIRLNRGMRQWGLAESIDYSRPTIPNIEKGKQGFSMIFVYRLCVALDCEITDILPKIKS